MKDKPDKMSYFRGLGIGIVLASVILIHNTSPTANYVLGAIGFALLLASLFISKEGKK